MTQRISKDKAKEFALQIYELIPQFCQDNLQEYMLFLQGRADKSENARNELKRLCLKGDKKNDGN